MLAVGRRQGAEAGAARGAADAGGRPRPRQGPVHQGPPHEEAAPGLRQPPAASLLPVAGALSGGLTRLRERCLGVCHLLLSSGHTVSLTSVMLMWSDACIAVIAQKLNVAPRETTAGFKTSNKLCKQDKTCSRCLKHLSTDTQATQPKRAHCTEVVRNKTHSRCRLAPCICRHFYFLCFFFHRPP